MTREAYHQAVQFLVQVVDQIPDDHWDSPGLGVWTIRDLVGHASRGLTTVETYWARPADRVDMEGPVDYFGRMMEIPGHLAQAAERGREAGRSLGSDPATTMRETARRVLAGLGQVPNGVLLNTPSGGIRLVDYLPTRILELTVHSLDIGRAIGLQAAAPQGPMAVTLHLLADLAIRQGKGATLALSITGRHPLPGGFSLVS